jgi:hypothetical protein
MAVSGEGMGGAPVEQTRRERVVDRRTWAPTTIGPGMILGALGAAGVITSMFLPWRTGSVYPSDIPVAFLWDHTTTAHDPSLLILLIPLAIVLVVGTVVPMGAGVRLFGAIGTLVVVGLFAYQLHRALDAFPGAKLGDVLDTGFYFAAVGGVVAFVSGFLPSGWAVRRTVDREAVVE